MLRNVFTLVSVPLVIVFAGCGSNNLQQQRHERLAA